MSVTALILAHSERKSHCPSLALEIDYCALHKVDERQ